MFFDYTGCVYVLYVFIQRNCSEKYVLNGNLYCFVLVCGSWLVIDG